MAKARLPFTRSKPSKAMIAAQSYDDWLLAATETDKKNGNLAWREADDSALFDAPLMRKHIAEIRKLIDSEQTVALAELIYESSYRHQGDVANPHLYGVAFSGTKLVIEDYLDTVVEGLNYIADNDSPYLSVSTKLKMLKAAEQNLGQSALLLSGGASMGFFHMGVAKALFDQDLLPKTICGASMGSLIGGGLCVRNDEELAEMFIDIDQLYRRGLKLLKPKEIIKQRRMMDQSQLAKAADENIGDFTFAEAEAHSGRQFCVSVSPYRSRQKPRVLSSKTSPNILVANAAIASSAIPGVFPPVMLKARGGSGKVKPYLADEKWVDGTFQGDLPMKRLGRLFNINHFIVSQVNPHAIPFLVSRDARGPVGLAVDLAMTAARTQTGQTLKVLQERVASPRLHNFMEHGRLLAEQEYEGDINIHPQLNGWMYRRMMSNPTVKDLKRYIDLGEKATWPKISMIRNQTRVLATVADCVRRLEKN